MRIALDLLGIATAIIFIAYLIGWVFGLGVAAILDGESDDSE